MKRRTFIAGLGGAAAWPMAAKAQQGKVWRVGYLSPASANDEISVAFFEAFRLKLQDLGYVEGKNLRLDVRRADGDYTRLPALAAELVSLAPDVIAATSSPATAALQRATSSIPIVMAAINDPIGLGFVKSLAKPGGNITGLSNLSADFTAKSFELLHVAVPNAKRIAVLTSPNPLHEAVVKEAYSVAGAMGLTIIPVMARTPADLNDAFTAMHKESCDAVVVLSDPRTSWSRSKISRANFGARMTATGPPVAGQEPLGRRLAGRCDTSLRVFKEAIQADLRDPETRALMLSGQTGQIACGLIASRGAIFSNKVSASRKSAHATSEPKLE